MITIVGATVTLVATLALLKVAAPSYAILGGLLGESVVAVATWRMASGPLRPASASVRVAAPPLANGRV
jgi:hypothetical protein